MAQESMTNNLIKQIEHLKNDRGHLISQVEIEEEHMMNNLQRRLLQVTHTYHYLFLYVIYRG